MNKKSLQFEIWQECNNLCTYCYLGKENRFTSDELKIDALNKVYERICSEDYSVYNNISFIGGEFFQGQLNTLEIKNLFMQIMQKTAELLKDNVIESVWLTTTMTLGDQKELYEVCELFKDYIPQTGFSGFWICTSWDINGRFHTNEMLTTWDFHMKKIRVKYPNIKFNTTIILMQSMIEAYLANEFSFKEFQQKYNTTLFFKQPGIGDIDYSNPENLSMLDHHTKLKQIMENKLNYRFMPTRVMFLRFLKKLLAEDLDLYDRLYNIQYRADNLIRNHNDEERRMEENLRYKDSEQEILHGPDSKINICGHLLNYAMYLDSNKCMICDKKRIKEEFE